MREFKVVVTPEYFVGYAEPDRWRLRFSAQDHKGTLHYWEQEVYPAVMTDLFDVLFEEAKEKIRRMMKEAENERR